MTAPVPLVTSRTAYQRDVAKILREYADRADAGEFTTCVIACERAEGGVAYQISGSLDYAATVGQLHALAAMLVRQIIG